MRLCENHHARRIGRCTQTGHQAFAGFFRHGMHAVHAVAWIQKLIEQLPRDVVVGFQRVHGRANGFAVGLDQGRGRLTMRFELNVLCEQLWAVFNFRCFLHPG